MRERERERERECVLELENGFREDGLVERLNACNIKGEQCKGGGRLYCLQV